MANDKTIEQRVEALIAGFGITLKTAEIKTITTAMRELTRDQRHLCAEAVNETTPVGTLPDGADAISRNHAYSRVFNADIK